MRTGEPDLFFQAMVFYDQIPFKTAGTDPDKSHAVAMAAVHVRLQLENISAERSCDGIDFDFGAIRAVGHSGMRAGRQMDEGIKKGLDPKIRKRGGKKDGSDFAGQKIFLRIGIAGELQKLQLFDQFCIFFRADPGYRFRGV